MNRAFEALKLKIGEVVAQGDVLWKELEQFGWKDDRPRRTKAKTELEFSSDLIIETPATATIPPEFVRHYHSWYAACLALVEANMPSRLAELARIHEDPKESNVSGTSMRKLLKRGIMSMGQQGQIQNNLVHMAAIVESVPDYLEGRLHDIELAVAQIYVGDQLLEAEALLKAGYVRPAGAMAGVLLERHLKTLCDHHQPPIKYQKVATISKLNDLLKNAGAYDVAQWRKVQWMGDIRNGCDHANKTEPKKGDVADLIGEVKKFVALFVL